MRIAGMAAVLALALAGCENAQDRQKELIGKILGAAGGAVAGAQFGKGSGRLVAVAVGTLAGAWLGSEVGKSLDRADRAHLERFTQRALESQPPETTALWSNPDTDFETTILPSRVFTDNQGRQCRMFRQSLTLAGETEVINGIACREPDGSWKTVT